MMAVAAALGVVVGAVLGLLGGGGSILAVPALVYGVGQSVGDAVPTSLLVVGGASAVAAVPRAFRGDVRWRVALGFGGAGILTSYAGAWVNHRLPDVGVLVGFAILMAVVGLRLIREGGDADPGATEGARHRLLLVAAAGAGVGFLTGLFGVGGGFVIVPALVLLLHLPMRAAVGTSLVVIVITSAAGFSAHLGQATIDATTAGVFSVGAVGAALAAGVFGRRIDDGLLRRGFGVLVLLVAAGMAASVLWFDSTAVG